MDWGSHTPHSHLNTVEASKPDSDIPAGTNYCRNPDGEDSIWCYTTDPLVRWELCDPISTTGSWTPTKESDGARSYVSIGPLHGPVSAGSTGTQAGDALRFRVDTVPAGTSMNWQ